MGAVGSGSRPGETGRSGGTLVGKREAEEQEEWVWAARRRSSAKEHRSKDVRKRERKH